MQFIQNKVVDCSEKSNLKSIISDEVNLCGNTNYSDIFAVTVLIPRRALAENVLQMYIT